MAWLSWAHSEGGPATGRLWLDTLIADVLATVVIFVFSRVYRNSSFYDAYWSVVPPLLLAYWWSQGPIGLSGTGALRNWLMAVVVGYWAVRLTANWVIGFPGLHHEDWRYPLLREGAGRFEFLADFFGIHLFPTVQVFVGMLPVYVALTRPGAGLVWLAWLAFVVRTRRGHPGTGRRHPDAPVRRGPAARGRDGSGPVGLVAPPQLSGRARVLAFPWRCSGLRPHQPTGGGCSPGWC